MSILGIILIKVKLPPSTEFNFVDLHCRPDRILQIDDIWPQAQVYILQH